MEEATGAPSSFAVSHPRRLRASGRDEGRVMIRPSSPLTMLLSRHTRRREFITLLGGAVAAWPLAARAQQPAMRGVGFVSGMSSSASERQAAAFLTGPSAETGYLEGQNVALEYHWLNGQYDQFPITYG